MLHHMGDLPGAGIELVPLHQKTGVLSAGPQGKSEAVFSSNFNSAIYLLCDLGQVFWPLLNYTMGSVTLGRLESSGRSAYKVLGSVLDACASSFF